MNRGERRIQTAIFGNTAIEAAFWSRVDKSLGPDVCWPWAGRLKPNGYGNFYHRICGSRNAHRVAFECATGEHPGDLNVCHSCDNRRCCNLKHLWLGTQKQNMQDAIEKGRHSKPPVTDWASVMRVRPHHWQRLTAEQALEIRRRALTGEDQTTIGVEFGVDSRTVSKIKLGQRWAHL